MSDLPKISIVTPSYNQGQFLEETIRSIISQGYPNLEYVIIDGGSTDSSLAVLRQYAAQYRMQWVSEPDQGQADALQKGFARCQGEIFGWLNADDAYLSPTVLSRVVSLFHAYPQAEIVTGGGMDIAADGRWLRQIEILPQYINAQRLRYVDLILQSATFFKKTLWERVRLDTSLRYAFDWDLFIQMAQHANMLAVNEPWAGYRRWGQNKTDAGGSARTRELLRITGRYVGRYSWQAAVLTLYYLLLKGAEQMPAPVCRRWTRRIRVASYRLRVLSNHRVSSA